MLYFRNLCPCIYIRPYLLKIIRKFNCFRWIFLNCLHLSCLIDENSFVVPERFPFLLDLHYHFKKRHWSFPIFFLAFAYCYTAFGLNEWQMSCYISIVFQLHTSQIKTSESGKFFLRNQCLLTFSKKSFCRSPTCPL